MVMMSDRPRIEGICKRIVPGRDEKGKQREKPDVTDIQSAIKSAGQAYKTRYGRPATHVALPDGTGDAGLELWTLNLAHPSGPGIVIVGRVVDQCKE
jgi:hypothetical protein